MAASSATMAGRASVIAMFSVYLSMIGTANSPRLLVLNHFSQHLVIRLPRAQHRNLVDRFHVVDPHDAVQTLGLQQGVGFAESNRRGGEEDDVPTAGGFDALHGHARALVGRRVL